MQCPTGGHQLQNVVAHSVTTSYSTMDAKLRLDDFAASRTRKAATQTAKFVMGAKFLPSHRNILGASSLRGGRSPLSSARLLEECDLRDLEGLGWIQRELNLSAAG